jgi:2-(1,2-epoxy-1,2-dihydrophenyl)acetyl-CoA isomerase
MSYTFISYDVTEGVATVTLDRPEVLNSFNAAMGQEVQVALAESAQSAAVRCVLLTGAGRAFCAGQDLAEAAGPGADEFDLGDAVARTYNPIVRGITSMEKPVVCAVNGVAAGAGANIALACDLVVAADNATFLQAFCKIGLVPDSGGTFFLPRLVGMARAKALTLLGDNVDANQAFEMGMIYKVVPANSLSDESTKLARYLATQPTKGLGLIKQALHRSVGNDLNVQLEVERELQAAAGNTRDYKEGVQAFLEKRKPEFRGD